MSGRKTMSMVSAAKALRQLADRMESGEMRDLQEEHELLLRAAYSLWPFPDITDRESRCTVVTKGDIEMRVHGQGELDRETIEALRDVCAAAYRRLSGEPTDATPGDDNL